MKRFLSIFVCLVLLLSVSVIFASCDEDDGDAAATTTVTTTAEPEDDGDDSKGGGGSKKPRTTTAVTTLPPIPSGYKVYSDGNISFAYPKEWTESEDGGDVKLSSSSGMSSIQIDDETPEALIELTEEDFEASMRSSLEEEGMSISEFIFEEYTVNGLKLRVVQYDITMIEMNFTMQQIMIFTKIDSTVYSLILTEYTPNPEIIETLLVTLSEAK